MAIVKEKRQFRIVNKGKGKLNIDTTNLHEVVGNTADEKEGGIALNQVNSYRSDFEFPYVYSGFLLNNVPVIKRVVDNTEEIAQGVTNLEVDWANRLILTYL